MIRAVDLTMRYAGVTALDGVSFEARPGEVLGFLGPNGAGKTTTMRILTGFLQPTRGTVEVCGRALADDSKAARARIGYLPESVPLYGEMRVVEYLRHRAALKGVPSRERNARLVEAAKLAGIEAELKRVIGQLSKGYRQRVGLADALLHGPEVLILDEPTDGLDPNQRRDVLSQVAELGKSKTVILSTHILPEVQSVCGRVIILDRGKIIAAGKPEELASAHLQLRAIARGDAAVLEAALRAVDGVRQVRVQPTGDELSIDITGERDVREQVAQAIVKVGHLRELKPAAAGLDEVFARLTRPAQDSDGARA